MSYGYIRDINGLQRLLSTLHRVRYIVKHVVVTTYVAHSGNASRVRDR